MGDRSGLEALYDDIRHSTGTLQLELIQLAKRKIREMSKARDFETLSWLTASGDSMWGEKPPKGKHHGGNMHGNPKTQSTGRHAKPIRSKGIRVKKSK